MQTKITDLFIATSTHILDMEINGTLGGGHWHASIDVSTRAGDKLFSIEKLWVMANDRGSLERNLREQLSSHELDDSAIDSIVEAVARTVRDMRKRVYEEAKKWIEEAL